MYYYTHDLVQAGILLGSGTAAILIAQRNERARRWGFGVALLQQPLWFWAAWTAGMWGIFALDIWYTIAYSVGLWQLRTP